MNTLDLREKLIIAYFVNKMTKSIMWITTPLFLILVIILCRGIDPMNIVTHCLASLGAGLLTANVIARTRIDAKISTLNNKNIEYIYYKKKSELDRLLKIKENLQTILQDKGEDLEFDSSRKKLQKIKNKICRIKFEINLFNRS